MRNDNYFFTTSLFFIVLLSVIMLSVVAPHFLPDFNIDTATDLQ
jgi:hypothetical protein